MRGRGGAGGGALRARQSKGVQGRQDLSAEVQPLGRRGACLGMWGAVWVSGRRLGMGTPSGCWGPC